MHVEAEDGMKCPAPGPLAPYQADQFEIGGERTVQLAVEHLEGVAIEDVADRPARFPRVDPDGVAAQASDPSDDGFGAPARAIGTRPGRRSRSRRCKAPRSPEGRRIDRHSGRRIARRIDGTVRASRRDHDRSSLRIGTLLERGTLGGPQETSGNRTKGPNDSGRYRLQSRSDPRERVSLFP